MKLLLDIVFCTDGDFTVRNIKKLFNPNDNFYDGAEIQYSFKDQNFDCGRIHFTLQCEGEEESCCWAARDLLENLIVNFSVAETHYYLVKSLYNFLETPLRELWNEKDINSFWTMDGNYKGTELRLHIEHE